MFDSICTFGSGYLRILFRLKLSKKSSIVDQVLSTVTKKKKAKRMIADVSC